MKKNFYIACVIALVAVLSAFVYGVVASILNDHYAKCMVIAFLILIGGHALGQHWWEYVYVQKKHRNKCFDKLFGSSKPTAKTVTTKETKKSSKTNIKAAAKATVKKSAPQKKSTKKVVKKSARKAARSTAAKKTTKSN